MKELTAADREVIRLVPSGSWFGVDDILGKVRNARFRLDRLEERGELESKVIGTPPDVTKMWLRIPKLGDK